MRGKRRKRRVRRTTQTGRIMREEDGTKRSGGRDREKLSEYMEGEGDTEVRGRWRSATLEVVGVLECVGRGGRRERRGIDRVRSAVKWDMSRWSGDGGAC